MIFKMNKLLQQNFLMMLPIEKDIINIYIFLFMTKILKIRL